jgi:hypothetical protein
MKWIAIISLIVSATFVAMFFITGSTWAATNAAGVVSLAHLLFLLYRTTRPPVAISLRRWARGLGGLVLAGTMLYWSTMYRMTNWQYEALHTIHNVIFHGVAISVLEGMGLKTVSAYTAQPGPKRLSIGDVFRKGTTYINADSSMMEVDEGFEGKLFAAAVSDTQVVLVWQQTIPIDGEDKSFKNFDGRTGMTQDRLIIKRRGLVYEIQN